MLSDYGVAISGPRRTEENATGTFVAGLCDYCSARILWPGGASVPYDPTTTHFGSLRLLLCETCIPLYKKAVGLLPADALPQIVYTFPKVIQWKADVRAKLLTLAPGSGESFRAKPTIAYAAARQLGMRIKTERAEDFKETGQVHVRRIK